MLARFAGIAILLGATVSACASEFSISPMSLQLTPDIRSSSVGISNSDQRPVHFQLSLVEWTQDAQGNDVYTPSEDLVYFPRQITVAPGGRTIARVGPKQNNAGIEKTYRLRVEEQPEPPTSLANGTRLDMPMVIAIPVFQGTPDPKPLLEMGPMKMQDGELRVTLRNAGRAHFRITTLEVTGADGYAQRQSGWYLLAGASRQHILRFATEACKKQQHLHLMIKVGDNTFQSDLAIDPSMCGV